jgi:alkanesulfonate monooxygenase SsuD/methylene tetrahydromethanopterin reductase-like flavin-dependent oxidoreductase (luciferase family)
VRKMIHFSGLISTDEHSLRTRTEAMAQSWNMSVADLKQRVLIGTPEQCAAHLAQFAEVGVEHFVLSLAPPYDVTMLELFVGEVAAALRK